jgi:hypothetical protein
VATRIEVRLEALREQAARFSTIRGELLKAEVAFDGGGALASAPIEAALADACRVWEKRRTELGDDLGEAAGYLRFAADEMERADAWLRALIEAMGGLWGSPHPESAPNDNPAGVPPVANGPQSVSGMEIVRRASAEVGTARATGWDQPGECIKSVQRWIQQAGGDKKGGGVVVGYTSSGAVEVGMSDLRPGDVLQRTFDGEGANQNWDEVHTVVVESVNADGSLVIIESNNPAGSGKVSRNTHWVPDGPSGWIWRAWRFGQP